MITRSQMPRQMYGLGSLVKKAVKGVKNIIKSPIGKAAIVGAGIYGLGGGFGGGFKFANLPGFTGAKNFIMGSPLGFKTAGDAVGRSGGILQKFGNMGTAGKLFTGGIGLKVLSDLFPQEEGEETLDYKNRISKLEPLLDRYYKNVNRNASPAEVKKFILNNTQEYRANGGRIGYRLGGDTMNNNEGIKSLEAGAPSVTYKGDMTPNQKVASETPEEEFELMMQMELLEKAYQEAVEQGYEGDKQSFIQELKMRETEMASNQDGIMQEAPMQMAANGGRIGLLSGTPDPKDSDTTQQMFVSDEAGAIPKINGGVLPEDMGNLTVDDFEDLEDYKRYVRQLNNKANGGLMRTNYAMGNKNPMLMEEDEDENEKSFRANVMQSLSKRMNQGGITELDYRNSGGFVPVGIKEKADDVPAMLSKNEFVMTADAVRAAGGGSVQKGAQKMYDTMKSLESKVV